MLTSDKILKKYGGYICRSCINKEYGVSLTPDDCKYESPYLRTCRCCEQARHTVKDFRMSGKLKTMFK